MKLTGSIYKPESDVEIGQVRSGRVLFGVAPTGLPHLGYLPALLCLQKLRAQGCRPILLVANFHAYLDRGKATWERLDENTAAYRRAFSPFGIEILETRAFYLEPSYTTDLLRFSAHVGVAELLKAAMTTVASGAVADASVAEVIYGLTQILDLHVLQVDLVISGMDEADIYRFGLPLVRDCFGRDVRHLYLPMCPGLGTAEMHASQADANKILLDESADGIARKLAAHRRAGGRLEPLAAYCHRFLLPLAGMTAEAELLARLEGEGSRGLEDTLGACIHQVLEHSHARDGRAQWL